MHVGGPEPVAQLAQTCAFPALTVKIPPRACDGRHAAMVLQLSSLAPYLLGRGVFFEH